jgi:hypothetical protein
VLIEVLAYFGVHNVDLGTLSDDMRASQAADLLDEIRPALNRAGILLPARVGGQRSWSDLEDTVDYAVGWLAPSASSGRPHSRSSRTRLAAIDGVSQQTPDGLR